ncbi:MAG: hypothetical protein IPH09_14615 [bacterium]|nr:hypothetical protein [bacterium]
MGAGRPARRAAGGGADLVGGALGGIVPSPLGGINLHHGSPLDDLTELPLVDGSLLHSSQRELDLGDIGDGGDGPGNRSSDAVLGHRGALSWRPALVVKVTVARPNQRSHRL